MLVIISDLHLTDGTSGTTIDSNAFSIFKSRLRDLAYAASFRGKDKYEPIKEMHVVLLGDIFDLIRSTQWLQGVVRPWDNSQNASFIKRVADINSGIIKKNRYSLKRFREMTIGPGMTVPKRPRHELASRSHSTPEVRKEDPTVKVNLYYQVGNHDWFYHLPGKGYDKLRKSVARAMGLANDPKEPFPHAPQECEKLWKVYQEHKVIARHGDIFDKMNFAGDRNKSSIGDGIVIDVITKFHADVASDKKLVAELPKEVIEGLKEIDNIRPLTRIPHWVNGLLKRSCSDESQADRVRKVWDRVAEAFLNSKLVCENYYWHERATMKAALLFSKGLSLYALGKVAKWFGKRVLGEDTPSFKDALKENAFKSRDAEFIVYGHTHNGMVVPLDLFVSKERCVEQLYVNTATWRRVFKMAMARPKDQEFLGHYAMTYAAFFKDNERNSRSFEVWSGTLGG